MKHFGGSQTQECKDCGSRLIEENQCLTCDSRNLSIKVYVCEGNISLDEGYLESLSGGKFRVKEVYATMDEVAAYDLIEASNNSFDFEVYDNYRESGNEDAADEYFEKNAKCISVESYDIRW